MSEHTAKFAESWDDELKFDDSGPSQRDHPLEYESAGAKFKSGICATLDSLLKANDAFVREVSPILGLDLSDPMAAFLFRQLHNRMVEIGRRALNSACGCSDFKRRAAPVPRTNTEILAVIHEAIALYDRECERVEEPGSVTRPAEGPWRDATS